MKYYKNNQWNDLKVKVSDTLPIGAEVDYDGSEVPDGWEEVQDNNLITNGTPIKTGRKIDNKDEYVLRVSGTLPSGSNTTDGTSSYISLDSIADLRNATITGLDTVILGSNGNAFVGNMGNFGTNNDKGFSTRINFVATDNRIRLITFSGWLDGLTVYVTIKYIEN